MMNRQGLYANASGNPYAGSQMRMQHISGQRFQQNAATSNFPGRLDSLPVEGGINSSVPSQTQQIPAQRFQQNAVMSNIPGRLDSLPAEQVINPSVASHPYTDPNIGPQAREEDMELGYEDKPSHLNFEGLERRFQDEILMLVKEQINAENTENARHREKIIEINNKYQEKLSVLRAQQASRREEFLRRELDARLRQYQQAGMNHPNNPHVYASSADRTQQPYPTGHTDQFNSYRDQLPFPGVGPNREIVERVPYPHGRVYGNASGQSF